MKASRLLILSSICLILLVSCAPSADAIQTALAQTKSAWTPIPTQTAYPTYTAPPTIYITKLILVTPTFTATPLYTPTITNIPAPTSTPMPTLDPLKADKPDGFYLVNVDIAPGIWRSTGTGDKCYWSITERTGNIIENFLGMSGGTAYIPADAFQVQFERCGTWVYLSPP